MGRTSVNTDNMTMMQKTTTTHSRQSKTSSLGQNVNTDNNWDAENNHKKLMTNLFSMVTVFTLAKNGMQRISTTVDRLLRPTVSMMQSNNNSYIYSAIPCLNLRACSAVHYQRLPEYIQSNILASNLFSVFRMLTPTAKECREHPKQHIYLKPVLHS